MNKVKILRLVDRELDLIAFVQDKECSYILEYPMSFYFDFSDVDDPSEALVMNHWLPLSVIESNKVKISKDKVLTEMEPNSTFEEYYLNIIYETFNNSPFLTSKESSELNLLLELNDAKHSNKIH